MIYLNFGKHITPQNIIVCWRIALTAAMAQLIGAMVAVRTHTGSAISGRILAIASIPTGHLPALFLIRIFTELWAGACLLAPIGAIVGVAWHLAEPARRVNSGPFIVFAIGGSCLLAVTAVVVLKLRS